MHSINIFGRIIIDALIVASLSLTKLSVVILAGLFILTNIIEELTVQIGKVASVMILMAILECLIALILGLKNLVMFISTFLHGKNLIKCLSLKIILFIILMVGKMITEYGTCKPCLAKDITVH